MSDNTTDDATAAAKSKTVKKGISSQSSGPSAGEIEEGKAAVGEIMHRNDAVMETFVTWCQFRATKTDEDMYAVQAQIISEILQADSAEAVLSERSALHARDILEKPLLLHGFEIHEGTYEDSQVGYYAAMTVSRPGSEETRIITCGATKILAKLYKLDEFGEWPQLFWFTERKSSKGYGVLDIVRPAI